MRREAKSARRKELRYERIEWLYRYLLEHPCVDCGESDPIVLDFDHVDGKTLAISRAIRDWGIPRLEKEIALCEVRCSNCHRRVTALDQDWTMAKLHYSS